MTKAWRRARIAVLATALISAASALFAGTAGAEAPIEDFEVTKTTTQAGGHPDLRTFFVLGNTWTQNFPAPDCGCHDPKQFNISMPAGVIPDVQATPQCDQTDFGEKQCAIDTQIGVSLIGLNGAQPDELYSYPIAVYNLVPHSGQPGLLGLYAPILEAPIYIIPSARTEGDFGLDLTSTDITHLAGVRILDLTIWGVPADPSHDPLRLQPVGCNSQGTSGIACKGGAVSNSPLRPYLSNPTTCGVPLAATLRVTAYDEETDEETIPFGGTTGCDQLSFNPSLFGQPTTDEADAPSGFDIDLKVPQNVSPTVPSPSQIRNTTVTLPEGFSINANAADGKSSCSDAQAHFDDRTLAAECPEFSKIATLSISSSSLPAPLPGYIYLGDPKPGDRYRILLVADGFGLHVKLPGSVLPDPQTGRLTVSFKDLPQFPFTDFNMHLFGSERGLLATPNHCGTYSVDSTFTPWDSALPDQSSHQFFRVDSGPGGSPCPTGARPFAPDYQAGVADKTAAAHSTFTFQITREDGEQTLSGIRLDAAPGVSANLRGVAYCPEQTIAGLGSAAYLGQTELLSSACPAASQVGTVTAGAGAGSRPLHVPGKVFLAGPYNGAPLSLAIVIPAVSGPYDLGNVVNRVALNVDPVDAHVTAVSDPLPQIVEGIPLRTRSIQVRLDRSSFMLNPTNCSPMSTGGKFAGGEGADMTGVRHFQVANCAGLPYAPKLSLKLTGGVRRLGHPAIHAVLTSKSGDANIRSVTTILPAGELLDNSHIGAVCTKPSFAADDCPPGSLIGHARVSSPILDNPLDGSIYLRSSRSGLPDIVIDLEGQFEIEAVGRIDSVNERYRATFSTVPDVPVSEIKLDLTGGSKGLLQNSESLCRKPRRAMTKMVGQNGVTVNAKVRLQVACGNARNKRHHKPYAGAGEVR